MRVDRKFAGQNADSSGTECQIINTHPRKKSATMTF